MRILRFIMLCWMLAFAIPAKADEIILYAYHLKPPYIIDRDKNIGLYFDLASYLNAHITGHRFKTVYLPRRRLEQDLEMGHLHGLVVGVHPSWFKDSGRTRYLWSPPFVHDEDVVVSLASAPVDYANPESLAGKRVGLSMGYYYYGVDELVQAGRVQRDDAIGEEVTLDKLMRKRVDAAIVTRRTLDILVRQRPEWKHQFGVARKPHDEFDRMILIPKEFAAVALELNTAMAGMMHDTEWGKILRSY